MGIHLKRTLTVVVSAFATGLFLGACAGDEPEPSDRPSLSEIREFRAYPVYYSGTSVAGNALREILGGSSGDGDERDATWILIYGDCDAEEGGCLPPLSIHSYSTCTRWAGPDARLIDVRGVKATKPFGEIRPTLEIFTGRTTVKIGANSQALLDSAVQALREVHQERPSRLPPPVPGSLSGELPCQDGPGLTR